MLPAQHGRMAAILISRTKQASSNCLRLPLGLPAVWAGDDGEAHFQKSASISITMARAVDFTAKQASRSVASPPAVSRIEPPLAALRLAFN